MLRKRHILSLLGSILIIASLFSELHPLLPKDTDNIVKRELEEKLKEQLADVKAQVKTLGSGSGDNHSAIFFAPTLWVGIPRFNTCKLPAYTTIAQHSSPLPLFLLYCSFKVHC